MDPTRILNIICDREHKSGMFYQRFYGIYTWLTLLKIDAISKAFALPESYAKRGYDIFDFIIHKNIVAYNLLKVWIFS